MRLLNTGNMMLRDFSGRTIPRYAVLSHVHFPDEICYADMALSSDRHPIPSTPSDSESDLDSDSDADVSRPGSRYTRRKASFVDAHERAWSRDRSPEARLATDEQRQNLRRAPSAYSDFGGTGAATPLTDPRDSSNSLNDPRPSPPFWKIRGALETAHRDGYDWIWLDTCCVDIKSKGEVEEAIENAWSIYSEAAICYVYLHDFELPKDLSEMDMIESDEDSDEDGGAGLDNRSFPRKSWRQQFLASAWHSRVWTLPELLASPRLKFYDRNWDSLSGAVKSQSDLHALLSKATFIPESVIARHVHLESTLVAARMTWMAGRKGSRPEDQAYALAGLFGVHLKVRYGEGAVRAFHRLQHEILKISTDESILLWDSPRTAKELRTGLLADGPEFFLDTTGITTAPSFIMPSKAAWSMTNRGLQASLFMTPHASPSTIGNFRRVWLNLCNRGSQQFMCFFIQQIGDEDEYVRVGPIIPVATEIQAFAEMRKQHTIIVPQISPDAENVYAGSPRSNLSPSTRLSISTSTSQSRPHIIFNMDHGIRRIVPHTPIHRPSWCISDTSAECISPIPHEDMYISIVQFELKTPSHATKIDGKFLVVACLRLLQEQGRWVCALRIDEAEGYNNEMPNLDLVTQRTLADGGSTSMTPLDVGIEGTREIRAEVRDSIEWHESAFEILITCPATTSSSIRGSSILNAGDRLPRAPHLETPLSFSTAPPTISGAPPRPRPQRYAGPPPASGYPPVSSRSGPRISRSMSVDHSASPYLPPSNVPPRYPPQTHHNHHPRPAPEASPPHSIRAGQPSRKRDSWNGMPPIAAPPTPKSPPRRPMTVRPGQIRPPLIRPPSRFGQGPPPSVYSPSYETPVPVTPSRRRDSGGNSSYHQPSPSVERTYWDNPIPDYGPSRRSTWTPAPMHVHTQIPPQVPHYASPRDVYAGSHGHGHSQSFHGAPSPYTGYEQNVSASPHTRSFGARMGERERERDYHQGHHGLTMSPMEARRGRGGDEWMPQGDYSRYDEYGHY